MGKAFSGAAQNNLAGDEAQRINLASLPFLCSRLLVAQAAGFSIRKRGFDSRREHHKGRNAGSNLAGCSTIIVLVVRHCPFYGREHCRLVYPDCKFGAR